MNALALPRLRLAVATGVLLGICTPGQAQDERSEAAEDWTRHYESRSHQDLPYRLMRPLRFDASERYPVIVSLHGGGGRGTDNRKQLRIWNRLLARERTRTDHPSYVLAPQTVRLWDERHLSRIKEVIATLPAVDPARIYILGHSMGGHGTYILLQLDPEYFAAAVPSAGTGLHETEDFIDAALIKDVPIWAFHGDADNVCPYERAQRLFDEMSRLGGNMKLTTWVGDAHGVAAKMIDGGDNGNTRCSSARCDEEPATLTWLFSQSLSSEE